MIPLPHLIETCRTLRHSLSAGVAIVKTWRQLATRGPRSVRPRAQRVEDALRQGDSLSEALDRQSDFWPPLFLAGVRVGEETGNIPEVLHELEDYFRLQLDLRRQFRRQSMMPVVNLVLAVFVLALLILILGWISPTGPGVFGLRGASGAGIFLGVCFGFAGMLWGLSRLLRRWSGWQNFLWKIPALGPCLQTLALGRLSLALRLTLGSGMSITRAVSLALRAADSTRFAGAEAGIVVALKSGRTLHQALERTKVFPREFLEVVAVAEEVGSVPERLEQLAAHYHEEAAQRLKTLTRLASLGVWFVYAAFMVWAIMSIAQMYLGALK